MFPTPRPLPTSVSRGGDGSIGSERLQPEFGEAFLAGSLVVDVVDDVVLDAGHTEEVCELIEHQSDCRVLAEALGVGAFVLAHLATSINDRQCHAARIASAGIDDHQRIAEAAAMGRFVSDMSDISVKERECS